MMPSSCSPPRSDLVASNPQVTSHLIVAGEDLRVPLVVSRDSLVGVGGPDVSGLRISALRIAKRARALARPRLAQALRLGGRVGSSAPKPVAEPSPTPEHPSAAISITNPLPGGVLTSPFGPRWGSTHRGIDLAAEEGSPILSAAAGVVSFSSYDGPGYGNLVEVDHGKGVKTRYAHCLEPLPKREGEAVQAGEMIARVGNTGRSTGPHLHFEVRRGADEEAVDPLLYLSLDGKAQAA